MQSGTDGGQGPLSLFLSRCSSQKPYSCCWPVVLGTVHAPGLLSHPDGLRQSQGKQAVGAAELGAEHLLPYPGPRGDAVNNLPPA